MRIITGRFRRRKLLTNPGLTTRPITDRVKESLFEYLNPLLPDKRVADVFAGTGTIGLEALSRGAASVVFIERDSTACELLRKNVETLDVQAETFCWQTDAVRTSFRPKNCDRFLPYDVVFFDPPYEMIKALHRGTMLYKCLERLARETVTSTDVLLLLRTPDQATFELPPNWHIERTLKYSTMEIHWLRKCGSSRVSDVDKIDRSGEA